MKKNINRVASVSALLLSSPIFAIDFTYHNGDPQTGYTSKGAPTVLLDFSDSLPNDVLTNIYSMLPESQNVNPAYIDDTLASNIVVDSSLEGHMTVTLTFLNEGAGYRNAFGYFLYDPDNPPATHEDIDEHVIVFPNASKPPQGSLTQGDGIDLGLQLTAGQAMGFFVVPNGWGWSGGYGLVSSLGPWGQPFYSLPHLNPEPDALQKHNVVFYDAANELFVIGFDDQHRASGDNDFNDILFSIEATPFSAVSGINEDGSVDANSYQVLSQTDTQLTSTSYYPAQNEFATLLYEDLWPVVGDYDFNDLVVRYRYEHTWNNENKLTQMDITFQVQSIGASFNSGFALHLPGVLSSNIESALLYKESELISNDIIDAQNLEANLILLSDIRQQVDFQCPKFRTEADCREAISATYKATVTLKQPVSAATLGAAPYDPYIFGVEGKYHGRWGGRSWEVHLKQFSGTDVFDTSLLNIEADSSRNNNYFINENAFPWALNLPNGWDHPLETVDIVRAYPLFSDWVLSNGERSEQWFLRMHSDAQFLYE